MAVSWSMFHFCLQCTTVSEKGSLVVIVINIIVNNINIIIDGVVVVVEVFVVTVVVVVIPVSIVIITIMLVRGNFTPIRSSAFRLG